MEKKGETGNKKANLFVGQFTSALVEVHVGLLANNVGVTTTHALDGGHGEHDLALAVDVGVHHTEDVLKLVRDDQTLRKADQNRVNQTLFPFNFEEENFNSPSWMAPRAFESCEQNHFQPLRREQE